MPDRSRRRRARWRRPLALGVGTAVVLVAAGGGVAWAMSGRSGDRYTTATVTTGSVQQTVSASGTVASSSRRDVAFPVAGTVASVAVGLGDTVTAGQVLASLDPASLQDALDQASTTLQEAQQTLSDDLESQTSSSSSSSSSSSGSSQGSGTQPGGSGSGGSGSSGSDQPSGTSTPSAAVQQATADVAAKQQALLAAYRDAHDALQASSDALTQAQTVCADVASLDPGSVGSTPSPSPSPSDDSTTSPDPDDSSTPTPSATAPSVGEVQQLISDCQAALGAAATAQDTTKTKQDAVNDAAAALDQAVAALQQALGASSGAGGQGSAGTGDPSGTPTGTVSGTSFVVGTSTAVTLTAAVTDTSPSSGSSGSQSGRETTVATAADILADQAAIDAAQAQVDIATKDLTLVDLTSPIAGTVGAVSITAGAQVSAQSTSAVITVLGTDGYVVDLTVPLSSVGKLAVGQTATVAVPSTAVALTGTVSSIGVLDVSSTSTPEYEVAVAVDATTEKLFDGSSAQVEIAVAATGQVLTVPTSAVHVDGSTATVQVLADGEVSDVTVQRGAVGAELTEITSGLTEGQTVVLADRDEPLDTGSSSSSSSGLSGLTSGTTTRVGVGGGGTGFAPGGGTFSGRG